jgi:hypothetical protein
MKIAATLGCLMMVCTLASSVGCANMMAKSVTQKQVAEFNHQDTDGLIVNYTRDVVFTTADGVRLQGRDALRAYFAALFATTPDLRMELVDQTTVANGSGYQTKARFKVTSHDQTVELQVLTQSRAEGGTPVAYDVTNTIDGLIPGSPVAMTLEHAAAAAAMVSSSGTPGGQASGGAQAGVAQPPSGDLLDVLNASARKSPTPTAAAPPRPEPAAQAPISGGIFVLPQ